MIPGFDCYSGYGQINFNVAREAGYRFVWVKCQEGNTGKDGSYERNVQRARDAGLAVGAYHFAFPLPTDPAHPSRDPNDQAQLYFNACKGLGSEPGDLSPALDLEWPAPQDWAKWGCTPQQISDWGRACCVAMAQLWGRLPVIYTYPHWWKTLAQGADVSWASDYPLWFADYSWPQIGHPPLGWMPPHLSWVQDTWNDWAACQHSADGSTARVPGVPVSPVDRNVIKDEATLLRLTGRSPSVMPVSAPIVADLVPTVPDLGNPPSAPPQDFHRFDEALEALRRNRDD